MNTSELIIMKKQLIQPFILLATLLMLGCNQYPQQTVPVSFNDPASASELEELPMDSTYDQVADVWQSIEVDPEYNSFIKLMNVAGMIGEFRQLNDITLFAPNQRALKGLTSSTLTELQQPAYLKRLKEILQYHVVPGKFNLQFLRSTALANGGVLRLETLTGGYITIQVRDNITYITDEKGNESIISIPDKIASNGYIHGVDALLIPVEEEEPSERING